MDNRKNNNDPGTTLASNLALLDEFSQPLLDEIDAAVKKIFKEGNDPAIEMRKAIETGDNAAALEVWKDNQQIFQSNDAGYSILCLAIQKERTGLVKSILNESSRESLNEWIDKVDDENKTLLSHARQKNNTELTSLFASMKIKKALKEGKNDVASSVFEANEEILLNDADESYAILREAIARGNKKLVESILDKSSQEYLNDLNEWKDKHDATGGKNLLYYAIQQPDTKLLALLIDKGFDVKDTIVDTARDGHALHTAAFFGRHQHIDLLLEKGADIDAENTEGHTPWEVALNFHPSFAGHLLQQTSEKDDDRDALRKLLSKPQRNFPDKPEFSEEEEKNHANNCKDMAAKYATKIQNEKTQLNQKIEGHNSKGESKTSSDIADHHNRIGDLYFNQAWLLYYSNREKVTPDALKAWEQAAHHYNAGIQYSENRCYKRLVTLEVSILNCVLDRPYNPPCVYQSPEKLRKKIAEKTNDSQKSIKNLWSTLLKEAEATLGQPPCPFILLDLGSLNRGEDTSNAGIQWGIMVEDHEKAHDQYFLNLSQYLNVKIMGLGQTPLTQDARQSQEAEKSPEQQGLHIHKDNNPLGDSFLGANTEQANPTLKEGFIGSMDFWIQQGVQDLENLKKPDNSNPLSFTPFSLSYLAASKKVTNGDKWITEYQNRLKSSLFPKKPFYSFRSAEGKGKEVGLSLIKEHCSKEKLNACKSSADFRKLLATWVRGRALSHGITKEDTYQQLDHLKQKKAIKQKQFQKAKNLLEKLDSTSTLTDMDISKLIKLKLDIRQCIHHQKNKRSFINIAATAMFVVLVLVLTIGPIVGLFAVAPPAVLPLLLGGMAVSGIVMRASDPTSHPDSFKTSSQDGGKTALSAADIDRKNSEKKPNRWLSISLRPSDRINPNNQSNKPLTPQ